MFVTTKHPPLEEFNRRLGRLEDKVQELLEHGEVTDEAIGELKLELDDQAGLLTLLIRQGRATTRTQCYLWIGASVIMFLLFIIVFKI